MIKLTFAPEIARKKQKAGVLISSGLATISFDFSSADKISPKLQLDMHNL
jgi:hypothetical protein